MAVQLNLFLISPLTWRNSLSITSARRFAPGSPSQSDLSCGISMLQQVQFISACVQVCWASVGQLRSDDCCAPTVVVLSQLGHPAGLPGTPCCSSTQCICWEPPRSKGGRENEAGRSCGCNVGVESDNSRIKGKTHRESKSGVSLRKTWKNWNNKFQKPHACETEPASPLRASFYLMTNWVLVESVSLSELETLMEIQQTCKAGPHVPGCDYGSYCSHHSGWCLSSDTRTKPNSPGKTEKLWPSR